MTARAWCCTLWSETWKKEMPDTTAKHLRHFTVGPEETCPTTGKKHHHMYAEFRRPVRFGTIKKMVRDKTTHCEPKVRWSTIQQALDYATKEGQAIFVYGRPSDGQGARTDLQEVVTKFRRDELSLSDFILEDPDLYARYRNGIIDIHAAALQERTKEFRQVEVIVLSGPTSCGKTRQAMEEATYRIQGDQLNWWCGYQGDSTICIDEYDNDVRITHLLALLDGYQLRLSIKGGHTYANWTKVFITTNLKRHEVHPRAKPAHLEALFRRISKWVDMWPNDILDASDDEK